MYLGNDIDLGTILGTQERIILTRQDRARHAFAVGASRTGKSKLLEGICRQDLLQYPNHQCPMVVIDPHGTLFDGLVGYAAAEGFDEWPIVPFDLRRNDLVVSYNLLRERRGEDAAVICRDFVDAILHSWKQFDTNATPRLGSWLQTTLMLAYEKECTLAEALTIINTPDLRRAIANEVRDMVTRSVLQATGALKEGEVQDRLESTLYRVNRFLSTQLIRATICQTGHTLDMSQVLEKGLILPICLSTEGTKITAEDASTLGSILVSDLWTSAQRRGKREEGKIAPCYVHIDEFQCFITPGIAKGLSQSSGFGLHFTLAHQYPSQLPDEGGELGKMILGAVLGNVRNRIAFQTSHPADLELLASILFRQSLDPDKIKDEIWSTKVVGHEVEYMPSYSTATAEAEATGKVYGETTGTTQSDGSSWNENSGSQRSVGQGDTLSKSEASGRNWQASHAVNQGETDSSARMTSKSKNFGPPTREFQEETAELERGRLNAAERDEYDRRWVIGQGQGDAQTDAKSKNRGSSKGQSDGGSISQTTSLAKTTNSSTGESDSAGRGGSRQNARQSSSSYQESTVQSLTKTESESWAPMLLPIMGKELSSRQFESIADQLHRCMQYLEGQPERHCIVRLASMREPVPLYTTTIEAPLTSRECTEAWTIRALRKWPFVLSMREATDRIDGRLGTLRARVLGSVSTHEPIVVRRKLDALPEPQKDRDII